MIDYSAIKKAAENYEKDMTAFLRELIAIPSESAEEEGVAKRIVAEMEQLGFDEAFIDKMGNVHGVMGKGEKIIAFDGHIDTVGLGELSNWKFDPYKGYENETEIGGRGGSDQTGGVVSAVYGAKIMKDLGLIPEGYKVLVTGTVQEEDCDGLCWQFIHNEMDITPEFVVITQPTDQGIYRGHRGRMEIRVEVKGVSCHGSAPERGDNAIYKMAEIVLDVKELTVDPVNLFSQFSDVFRHVFPSLPLSAAYWSAAKAAPLPKRPRWSFCGGLVPVPGLFNCKKRDIPLLSETVYPFCF